MKKIIYLSILSLLLCGTQVFAAHRPPVNRPPMPHRAHYVRPLPPPMFRPYNTFYYSVPRYTTYTYYTYNIPAETVPVSNTQQTVIVKEENNYAGVNTAANVINTAANVAATIKYLSW